MVSINQNPNYITYGQMNLTNNLRRLWTQLVMWRRALIVSEAANFGDMAVVAERLYHVPTDFKDTFEVFFGTDIAKRFESLLSEQIALSVEKIKAEKEGNREIVDANTVKMYQNADEMAAFLAQINPYWSEEMWQNLLYKYYSTTNLEMVMILAGRYEEAVALYENLEAQALDIADYMAKGFIQYFTV